MLSVLPLVAQTLLSSSSSNLTSGAGADGFSDRNLTVIAAAITGIAGAGLLAALAPKTIMGLCAVTAALTYNAQRK